MVRRIPPTLRAGTPDLPAVPRWMQVWIILLLGPILTWAETRIFAPLSMTRRLTTFLLREC